MMILWWDIYSNDFKFFDFLTIDDKLFDHEICQSKTFEKYRNNIRFKIISLMLRWNLSMIYILRDHSASSWYEYFFLEFLIGNPVFDHRTSMIWYEYEYEYDRQYHIW